MPKMIFIHTRCSVRSFGKSKNEIVKYPEIKARQSKISMDDVLSATAPSDFISRKSIVNRKIKKRLKPTSPVSERIHKKSLCGRWNVKLRSSARYKLFSVASGRCICQLPDP